MISHLAGSFVGAHLQADGGLVVGLVRLCLWVVEMSSGAVGRHPSLARTLVGSHLEERRTEEHTIE